jgi:hypothetical protein
VGKEEALLMRENKPQGHNSEKPSPCQISHLFDGISCVEAARESVDGLLLCERHALEAKLEGQITCWDGILTHVDLWSREATRRDRPVIVGLLNLERMKAASARQQACSDLDLARSETSIGEAPSLNEVLLRACADRDAIHLLEMRAQAARSSGEFSKLPNEGDCLCPRYHLTSSSPSGNSFLSCCPKGKWIIR